MIPRHPYHGTTVGKQYRVLKSKRERDYYCWWFINDFGQEDYYWSEPESFHHILGETRRVKTILKNYESR